MGVLTGEDQVVQSQVSDTGYGESGSILLAGAYLLQKYSDARSHEAAYACSPTFLC